MATVVRRRDAGTDAEPVRILGRGLRAQRGVRLTLRVLREAAGKTQTELAMLSQIDQADISRLEGRSDFDDCQLATIRRYVEALGGKLEILASFREKKITLSGVVSDAAAQQVTSGRPGSRRRRIQTPR